jgi:hypothetical protein
MALNARSIAAAARKKAQHVQDTVRGAEHDLKVANEALQGLTPAGSGARVRRVAARTAAAEAQMRQAADELEAVKALLDDSAQPDTAPAGRRSGEGSQSVLHHVKSSRPRR